MKFYRELKEKKTTATKVFFKCFPLFPESHTLENCHFSILRYYPSKIDVSYLDHEIQC